MRNPEGVVVRRAFLAGMAPLGASALLSRHDAEAQMARDSGADVTDCTTGSVWRSRCRCSMCPR